MKIGRIPPLSADWARVSVAGIVLLGPLYLLVLPYALMMVAAWGGWSNSPARFWKVITLISFVVAFGGGGFWVWNVARVVGDRAGMAPALPAGSGGWDVISILACWASTYVVCWLLLLPHASARLIYASRRGKAGEGSAAIRS